MTLAGVCHRNNVLNKTAITFQKSLLTFTKSIFLMILFY